MYFKKDFIEFFKELASHNNKDWFDANRERYLKSVKEPFAVFVTDVLVKIKKVDKELKAEAKDCIFRINRDIRFSKDKTPYKITSSALLAPKGRKSMDIPSFYIELGPEKISFYGGAYFLDTASLQKVRSYIQKNMKEFEKLISDKNFVKKFDKMQGEESSRIPKEFKTSTEKQPLLIKKQFYFGVDLKPKELLSKDFLLTCIAYHKASMPMISFLRKALK